MYKHLIFCASAYLSAVLGVAAATGGFWLVHSYLDKGQASLLYLPVVIACAVRLGFGPSVLAATLSFLSWDFFFLPPFYTLAVSDPRDWLSLFVFLIAAVTTAQLASQARQQTQQAQVREHEIGQLFEASEAISKEVRADRLLAVLASQLQSLCQASQCFVFRSADGAKLQLAADTSEEAGSEIDAEWIRQVAEAAFEHHQVIGFGRSENLWTKAIGFMRSSPDSEDSSPAIGAYVPLQADNKMVGVLHVGPRRDGMQFTAQDERLILTLANHAAVVIARDALAAQAAQAQALHEADLLKDSLLSLVSHELRTPLAAIKASASGLLQSGDSWADNDRSFALHAIDTEADRLTRLVSNLLDLSRIQAGSWQPSKDWCDLNEIIATALDRLPEHDVDRVVIETADDIPLIPADYLQITLVLTNLLENAIKYTPQESPITILVHAMHHGPCGEPYGVIVVVRDHGHGLQPGEEERLFERFYRGQAEENSIVRGTGLGLALCQAIIKAHGGRIWAANAPEEEGRGAIFSFILPSTERCP